VFEVVKYVAPIAFGYLIGVIIKRRPPQLLFTVVVVALVFFVSANAAGVVLGNLATFLVASLLYALTLVVVTAVLGSLVDRGGAGGSVGRPSISIYVATSLVAGLIVGGFYKANYAALIDPLLIFLLLIAGIDMAGVGLKWEKRALLAPAVALAGAAAVAPLFTLLLGITPAVAFGLGWYSFTGPYLASVGDEVGGAYGLLVNFLREQLTFLLGPLLARRFSRVGVLAAGGATTMDNTLPLYVALYGPSFSLYAFANGVVLTFLVPAIVPLVHTLALHP